jgi:hypothetical protein
MGSISDEAVVGETPAPGLADFEGADDWMLRRPGVLAGVGVLRLVTTPDTAATETKAEMDPGISNCQTLGAAGAGRFHLVNRVEMLARW